MMIPLHILFNHALSILALFTISIIANEDDDCPSYASMKPGSLCVCRPDPVRNSICDYIYDPTSYGHCNMLKGGYAGQTNFIRVRGRCIFSVMADCTGDRTRKVVVDHGDWTRERDDPYWDRITYVMCEKP
jgi:hypothetical protein